MADVVHEEACLSCSSSDSDEHADLLTDAEDLADTDSEGSAQHLGIEPYQFEPYLSDAGAVEDGGSESDGTGSDEDDEGSERHGNNEWLVDFYGRDCRLKYNFNFEDMSFCGQYETFFIQIH